MAKVDIKIQGSTQEGIKELTDIMMQHEKYKKLILGAADSYRRLFADELLNSCKVAEELRGFINPN